MNARGALGRYGEDVAVRTLTAAGMRILARNWRVGRVGEIDVVARDGDVLVMCEVKTRRPGPFGHPSAAITAEKAKRLHAARGAVAREVRGPPPGGVRIDLVGVVLPPRGAARVEHVRGLS